jgi:formylglycine-generating enzyme required for sulfatase activity
MEKKYLVTFVLCVTLSMFNCVEQVDDDNKTDETSSSLFTGISYRDMVSVTGGTYIQSDGSNSFSHTVSSFSIGKYEVTYELWFTVYQWAVSHGYTFANQGREGHDGTDGAAPTTNKYEPVTQINWRDAIVWCNAYSEMSGFAPCYTYSGTTIKDSRDSNATAFDGVVCNWTASGYRLPSEGEWQYAASNKGATPYNYASGATADYNNATETQKVAWYTANSGSSTKVVGTTTNSSALTLWDMSGNVWELCWDWFASFPTTPQTDYRGPASGSGRVIKGGYYSSAANLLNVGNGSFISTDGENNSTGFRVARSN